MPDFPLACLYAEMIDLKNQLRHNAHNILQHFDFTRGCERAERSEAGIKGVKINNFRQDLQDRHDIFLPFRKKGKNNYPQNI
jgi:hypothetical protein